MTRHTSEGKTHERRCIVKFIEKASKGREGKGRGRGDPRRVRRPDGFLDENTKTNTTPSRRPLPPGSLHSVQTGRQKLRYQAM